MTNLIFEKERREDEVWLQGIGWRKAIPAGSLEPGMVTIWNGGATETIKSMQATKSGKSVKCVIIAGDGKEYSRTMRVDRLVGLA